MLLRAVQLGTDYMSTLSTNELAARIAQLEKGLITECEFVAALQLPDHEMHSLVQFNSLEIDLCTGDFSVDDFNKWRNL